MQRYLRGKGRTPIGLLYLRQRKRRKRAALRESDFILCYYGNISPSDAYKENKVFQKMQNPPPTAA